MWILQNQLGQNRREALQHLTLNVILKDATRKEHCFLPPRIFLQAPHHTHICLESNLIKYPSKEETDYLVDGVLNNRRDSASKLDGRQIQYLRLSLDLHIQTMACMTHNTHRHTYTQTQTHQQIKAAASWMSLNFMTDVQTIRPFSSEAPRFPSG